MDIVRFMNPTSPTKMEQGVIVNGLKSKMWVERYLDAGEFEFTAPASSYIRNQLPIGALITHADTAEIMIVENHEIAQSDTHPDIKITGRGFESFLENRIVRINSSLYPNAYTGVYVIASDYTWIQVVSHIKLRTAAEWSLDDDDVLPYVTTMSEVTIDNHDPSIPLAPSSPKSFKLGQDIYSTTKELLSIDKLGIKVIRPGTWSPLGPDSPDTAIVIHEGINRTKELIFSSQTGETTNAEYLWSNKNYKNAAMITGKWVATFVTDGTSGLNRRIMYVDGSDIDDRFTDTPSGSDFSAVVDAMTRRGEAALASQRQIALVKAEIARNASKAKYRKDFNVGDRITIVGDYDERTTKRVIEYVEIEDQSGKYAYPTLEEV